MKILIYNIAYATGSPRSHSHAVLSAHRALLPSNRQFALLKKFIIEQNPDIIGLIEVDFGSYRSAFSCQAHHIATNLG
ncbi:MAG: endonuclease/exonuclease/phosphatase family protein, partial [Lentisphaeria bacterium]